MLHLNKHLTDNSFSALCILSVYTLYTYFSPNPHANNSINMPEYANQQYWIEFEKDIHFFGILLFNTMSVF